MHIRLLQEHDTPAAKELWGYAFEKDEPFYSWYFKEVFQSGNCIGVFIDDRLACCLQIPSYKLQMNGNLFKSSYVVGVVTSPEYRNKGIMKSLLKKAIEEIRSRNHFVSILMPFDTAFYRPYGWELCYSQLSYETPIVNLKDYRNKEGNFHRVDREKDMNALDRIYREYLKHNHGYVIRSEENWKVLLQDLYHYGGCAAILHDSSNQPVGYIQYTLKGDKLIVKEMAYVTHWAKQAIFGFLYSHYSQANTIQWPAPANDNTYLFLRDTIKPSPTNSITLRPFMCGRVIDVSEALEHSRYPETVEADFRIKIEDAYASWNNTTFHVLIKKGIPVVKEDTTLLPDLECGINTFAQLFFGAVSFQDAIAMDTVILHHPNLEDSLSRIFVRKDNFINEYY